MNRRLVAAGLALCISTLAGAAHATDATHYPNKPIKLIVGYAPGGSTDILARLLARRLQEGLGQPVVVENRPGTSGIVGASVVAKAPADGYTLMVGASCDVSIGCSPGWVWETGVTTLQSHRGIPPDEQP